MIITNTLLIFIVVPGVLEFCRLRSLRMGKSHVQACHQQNQKAILCTHLNVIALTYNTAGSFSAPRRDHCWVISYCHRPHTKWNGFMSEGNYRKFVKQRELQNFFYVNHCALRSFSPEITKEYMKIGISLRDVKVYVCSLC